MEKKTVKYFDDFGFGFQVRVLNAPMLKVRGEWVLDVDQQKLQRSLLCSLASKSVRLTGSEIRYIRSFFNMTSTEFGQKFNVTHAAVLKWERAGANRTEMNWSTEKDIRLFVAARVQRKASDFIAVYKELEEKADDSEMLVKIDGRKVA
jgi:DNA-binding transcriptional regulator YiaG